MKKNVVRVLALVLVALMCLSLIPLAAHAEAHVHEMATDHQDPTCVEVGFDQTYCPICNTTFSMNYIPATGVHSFIPVEDEQYMIEEGDCTHPYQYWKSCSVCQQSAEEAYGLAVDKLVEELTARKQSGEQADWETVAKDRILLLDERYKFSAGGEGHHILHVDRQEATCTSDGWKEYTWCDVCGERFNFEAIPAKGHRWNEFKVTKEATCTEDGSRERVCEVCDKKDVQVIPALGHTWTAFKVTKAATCTEDGSQERTCTVCGAKEVQVIPAAHKFGAFVVIEEPTCYASGTKEHTCTVCGHKETESIPAAHKFGEFVVTQEPTCYSTGAKERVCSVCGEKEVEWIDMAHKYENGVCVFCGEDQPEGETQSVNETQNAAGETAAYETAETEEQPDEAPAVPENAIYISFDGNGATSGSMDAQAFEPGTSQNLNLNAFVRTGYKFVGWDYMADGSGMGDQPFLDGEEVTLNSDVTLYAQWAEDPDANTAALAAGETLAFEAGTFTVILTNPSEKYPGTALVDDEIIATVTPAKPGLLYKWSRQPASGNPLEEDICIVESNTYTVNSKVDGKEDLNGAVFCVVIDPETGEEQRSNNIRVRKERTIDFTAQNGVGTISYIRENVPQEPIIVNPGDTVSHTFLTLDRVTLALEPNDDFLFRQIGYINNQGVCVAQKTLADDPRTHTLTVSTSTQTNWLLQADQPHLYNSYEDQTGKPTSDADKAIEQSGAAENALKDLIAELATQYGVEASNFSIGDITYVTPIWNTGMLAMNKVEISFTDGFSFKLPNPAGLDTKDILLAFHYEGDSASGTWKKVPDSNVGEKTDTETSINSFKDFSPFVVVGLDGVQLILKGEGSDKETVPYNKGSVVKAPSCPVYFTAPEKKSFYNWLGSNDTEYAVGDELPVLTDDFTLTAQWKAGYSVTFNKGDDNADGSMDVLHVFEGVDTPLTGNKFSLKNSEFLYWSETPNGEKKFDDGHILTTEDNPDLKNLELYAVWKPTHSTVTFDGNGASAGTKPEDQTAPLDGSIVLNKNTFKYDANDSKIFAGWSIDKNVDAVGTLNGVKLLDGAMIDTPARSIAPSGVLNLYAVWRKPVKVTFYPNGGGGSINPNPQILPSGEERPLNTNTFTAPTGTVFEKWTTNAGGTGTSYNDGQNITLTGDTPLYAQWTSINCTIKFDPNGGKGEMADQPAAKETSIKLNKNMFEREGYGFIGWKTDGGDEYEDEDSITIDKKTDEVILHAQWKPVWTISFDKNSDEATGNIAPLVFFTDSTDKLPGSGFTRTNYKLKGWSRTSGENAPVDFALNADAPAENITLYAVWERETITISFDGNGATTGKMDTVSWSKGVDYSAPENPKDGFVKKYNDFKGWKINNTGDIFKAGDTIPASKTTENITLYAQWEQTTFVVTFNPGSATGESKTQTFSKGVAKALDKNPYEYDHYLFVNWKDQDNNTYTDKQRITPTKDLTLTAQWVEAWTVKFEKNAPRGATVKGEMPDQMVEKGKSLTLNANQFKCDGYTFLGWSTRGGGNEHKDKDTFTPTTDIVLEAIWGHTITFNGNGSTSGKMDPQTGKDGASIKLNKNVFKRTNYDFKGWQDQDGKFYADELTFNLNKELQLSAVWEKVTYSVIYHPNKNPAGGGSMNPTEEIPLNGSFNLPKCSFTAPVEKPMFGEWNTEMLGTGISYMEGEIFPGEKLKKTDNEDITLYAIWRDKLSIQFHPGSGSGTAKNVDEPKNSVVKLPSYSSLGFEPLAGQTFAGWQLGDDEENLYKSGHKVVFGDVDFVDKETETVYTTARKVTAKWGDTITITYDPNGATASSRKLQKAAKNNDTNLATISQIGYTRSGYGFLGWALSASAKEPKYLDAATVDGGFSQDTTLYAVWEQQTFIGKVTIKGNVSGDKLLGFVGETLEATVSGDKVFTDLSYQWLRDNVAIDGATASTYVPTPEDFGLSITCVVSAKRDGDPDPQKKESNPKDIFIEEEDKDIVNNGEAEVDVVYGVYDGMYYSVNNGVKHPVTSSLIVDGAFTVNQHGVYHFFVNETSKIPVGTVYVYNWWTIGFNTSTGTGDNSGSGTVTMKRGSTTLSGSTTIKDSSSGEVILKPYSYYGYSNVWIVRQDAGITDITMTVKPSSGSYGHVALNGGSYESNKSEKTYSFGSITGPMLYDVIFNKTSTSPKTGDMSHLGLWSGLCLTSFVGAATILGSARKRKKEQD